MEGKMLLVADDNAYNQNFIQVSSQRGLLIDCAKSMDEAFELISKNEYNLLDICADCVDYLNEVGTIRRFREMPILLFSFSKHSDSITALRSGAQVYLIDIDNIDYLVESSIAIAEFYLRIKHNHHITDPVLLTYGCVHMSIEAHQVFIKGTGVNLTKLEFELLRYFLLNKGIVVTYEQIYNNVWGWSADISYHNHNKMHALVRRLRNKLACTPEVRGYITAVSDVGYRFGTL